MTDDLTSNISFVQVRNLIAWKQKFFGLLFGIGKQGVSRFETGERKETLQHKEMLSFVVFLDQKGLLGEYVSWRFNFQVKKHFYKNGTPMEYYKYIKKNSDGQNH